MSNSTPIRQTNLPEAEQDFKLELPLELDRSRPRELRVQLEHQLREAIQQGRLAAGSPLPPSRALAAGLQLSRSVVVEAYAQLVAEGYVEARRGSATRVRAGQPGLGARRPRGQGSAGAFQFHSGLPDPRTFPAPVWLRHYRAALQSDIDGGLGYPRPQGESELRVALADYLARVRAVRTTPERLIVCGGFTQGLALICRALRSRGAQRIAVENPCFSMHRTQIRASGIEPVAVPVDGDGIDVSRLAESDVDAVLVAPAHSYPTGVALSPERRGRLLDWARSEHRLLIEDDYDADFRYDRAPIGALQGLGPEHVIYGGTVSKTLSPALRLGWIAVPEHLLGELVRVKFQDDIATEAIGQRTLARFIEAGDLTRHLRRVRPIYRARRETLVAALEKHLPGSRVTGIPAGLQAFVVLDERLDEAEVLRAAGARGVHVEQTARHWADRRAPFPALLIGFGTVHDSSIEAGVQRLAEAVRSVS